MMFRHVQMRFVNIIFRQAGCNQSKNVDLTDPNMWIVDSFQGQMESLGWRKDTLSVSQNMWI